MLAILQHAAAVVQDSTAAARDLALRDTVNVASPLPGGAAAFVRFLFNLPQWFQIAGFVAGVIVAIALLIWIWHRRNAILQWLQTRSRRVIIALASVVVVGLITASVLAAVSWHYMMHDNGFCTGCHVMTPAFTRFATSEHRKLECHDCHRQSIFASMRQLYFWVAERPDRIPPHAKVPTRICSQCHVKEQPDTVWERIIATAGHRIHLNSDSAALRGVQCVTCHGQELHRFLPVDKTCGQSNCHDQTRIVLGKMASQSQAHCVSCHQFTTPVAENISLDSTRRFLTPTTAECLDCHQMRAKLAEFVPEHDPHKGVCGSCHNPHEQKTPQEAARTCTTAGCHARPETLTPFHRGIAERALADCVSCHKAHDWVVRGSSCLGCHRDIFQDRRAAGRVALVRPASFAVAPQSPAADSMAFSHRRHRAVECTTCHASGGQTHGALKVRNERDCMSCHHAPERAQRCIDCHRDVARRSYEVPSTVRMTVWREPRARTLGFRHDRHRDVACRTCHTAELTLAVGKDCASCHTDHHAAAADCRACHQPAKSVHRRNAHLGCTTSGCHRDQAVSALAPTRNVCLVCHADMANHKAGRECAQCHQVAWSASAR